MSCSILRQAAPEDIDVDVVSFSWFDAELDRPDLAGVRERLLSPRAHSLVARPVTLVHPPVVPRYWTPRNDVLVTLDKWWREGTESVLVLVGLGGTGKSTVVQRWLNDIVGETETGQLEGLVQFSLYEPGDRAFGDFLGLADRALGAPLAAGDEVDVLLDLLAERRVLLVLDGAERPLREYAAAAPEFVEERDPVEVPTSAREIVDEAAWRFIVGIGSRKLVGRVVLTTRLMPLDLDEAERCRRLDLGGLGRVLRHARTSENGRSVANRAFCAAYAVRDRLRAERVADFGAIDGD